MKNSRSNLRLYKTLESIKYLILAWLMIVFSMRLILSFSWRLRYDTAFMHYVAYLINEHGFLPYRDIFEVNMPVSYLFHMAVGKFFGYSDLAFILVNLVWLTATLAVTWFIMKPFGRVIAFTSCLIFGIIYLKEGGTLMLQRDFIAILPMATALLLTRSPTPKNRTKVIYFLIGVLFALAALIKPHLVIGLPLLIIYKCIDCEKETKSEKTMIKKLILGSLFSLIGFILTLAIPFLWLWKIGAIEAFWDLLSSYVPLYGEMSGSFEILEKLPRLKYLLWSSYENFGKFKIGALFMSSFLGVHIVIRESSSVAKRKLALLLLLLTLIYSVYVIIGGKFWEYHWIPFQYFACLCTALVIFSPGSFVSLRRMNILPLFIFIFLIIILTLKPASYSLYKLRSNTQPFPLNEGRVEEIATYLNENLSPTDKVQPLDWITGGAVHAMLLSNAVVATPYITDFQFYHHVSTPYIQKLRKDFLAELKKEMPTFIIDIHKKSKVSGIDTSYSFPELEEFIKQHYIVDYTGKDYEILRRNDESG